MESGRTHQQQIKQGTDVSDYRRNYTKGGTLFFTAVTYGRNPIFLSENAVELLNKSFQYVVSKRPFEIDAMVILPDHLHCIWTLPENDFDFSLRWRLLKSFFSRKYLGTMTITESMREKREKGVWQRRFWEHTIRDQQDYNRHCDYIHYNPVKHGFVTSPGDWVNSSFRRFVDKGLYPADWGCDVDKGLLKMNLE